jgi:hypothetical protein
MKIYVKISGIIAKKVRSYKLFVKKKELWIEKEKLKIHLYI